MKYAIPNCVYTKSRRTACTVHLMKTTEASQRGGRKAIYGKILHRYWCKIPNKKCRYRQTDWLWAHEMSLTDFALESRHDDAEVLLVTVYSEYKLLENTWMKKKHWESNFSFTQECKLHQEDVVLSKYFKIMQLHLRRCKMQLRTLLFWKFPQIFQWMTHCRTFIEYCMRILVYYHNHLISQKKMKIERPKSHSDTESPRDISLRVEIASLFTQKKFSD